MVTRRIASVACTLLYIEWHLGSAGGLHEGRGLAGAVERLVFPLHSAAPY
jgi:hypothetical protein